MLAAGEEDKEVTFAVECVAMDVGLKERTWWNLLRDVGIWFSKGHGYMKAAKACRCSYRLNEHGVCLL